ncbi:hypothetical protein BDY21DRAFT_340572 [Lineolata rhizophorae]|uniref:Uncharacterized protein n=1 Tax=Lineolata rhizophorae TaxID=578093 RepID=A0A6A6P3V1_9PEZI|nr:hypothetical protein BDY21DRAFT_340572 [Lineolata rhizophorae]
MAPAVAGDNNIWAQMAYTPPRGPCNHKQSLLSQCCPCLRFMLHPVKAMTSFDCDGCGHHASFHTMENQAEDAIVRRWESEARLRQQQQQEEEEAAAAAAAARPRKRPRRMLESVNRATAAQQRRRNNNALDGALDDWDSETERAEGGRVVELSDGTSQPGAAAEDTVVVRAGRGGGGRAGSGKGRR